MITTKTAGIGEDTANPKPVRHVNWTGQPMKEGDNYWGESEPQPQPPPPPQVQSVVRVPRKAKRGRKVWSPEARAEYSAKMKAWWQAKRNATNSAPKAEA